MGGDGLKATKIPCAVFRWIEYELYNLEWHKEELRRLKEEILLKSPDRLSGSGKANAISDQTGQKAVKLTSDMRIINLERKISAVETSLKRQMFSEIYEYKYRRCLPWQEVIMEMNVSESTFKRIRAALIKDIAIRLGELGHIKKLS